VVRHIFQACPVWIYTQSNLPSQASYSPEYITPTQMKIMNQECSILLRAIRPHIKRLYVNKISSVFVLFQGDK
jgi:hypothetical protein